MVDIISKRGDEPRPEDARIRRVLAQNRPVIDKLADHLTNGAWSNRNKPAAAPQAEGLMIHTARASTARGPAEPFVRVALNGRVSMVDANTGRQMHHLGDLRRGPEGERFRLATRENGFFSPLDPEIAALLADFDGQVMEGPEAEPRLTAAIGEKLEI
jgi:hypothetical protein